MVNIACVGRLVSDPELSQHIAGCTNLRIAVTMSYDAQKRQENTAFFSVSIFGKRGEACAAWLHKGDMVFVTGQFHIHEYTGRDGTPRTSYDIRNAEVQFLPKGTGSGNATNAQEDDDDDMLPE